MNKDNINRRNTREWVNANELSKPRSAHFRHAFVEKFGGHFKFLGQRTGWRWNSTSIDTLENLTFKFDQTIFTPMEKKKSNWIFVYPDGKEEIVENLSKFCRKHSLNKAAMYEVYHGKRNHHKNFKLKKQGD